MKASKQEASHGTPQTLFGEINGSHSAPLTLPCSLYAQKTIKIARGRIRAAPCAKMLRTFPSVLPRALLSFLPPPRQLRTAYQKNEGTRAERGRSLGGSLQL